MQLLHGSGARAARVRCSSCTWVVQLLHGCGICTGARAARVQDVMRHLPDRPFRRQMPDGFERSDCVDYRPPTQARPHADRVDTRPANPVIVRLIREAYQHRLLRRRHRQRPALRHDDGAHVELQRLLGLRSAMLGGSAARSDFFREHTPCAFQGWLGFGFRMCGWPFGLSVMASPCLNALDMAAVCISCLPKYLFSSFPLRL